VSIFGALGTLWLFLYVAAALLLPILVLLAYWQLRSGVRALWAIRDQLDRANDLAEGGGDSKPAAEGPAPRRGGVSLSAFGR
jgi:hypothetical protein